MTAIGRQDLVDARAAFAGFYADSYATVYRAVLVVTRDRDLAADAVSTAFTRAWERWSEVSRHPVPAAWVARVAMNDAISSWRVARRLLHGRHRETTFDVPDPDIRAAVHACLCANDR